MGTWVPIGHLRRLPIAATKRAVLTSPDISSAEPRCSIPCSVQDQEARQPMLFGPPLDVFKDNAKASPAFVIRQLFFPGAVGLPSDVESSGNREEVTDKVHGD